MAFDFPSSPSVGQVYSSGGVSYRWDGQAWMGSPMSDAGIFVKKAGDTMTGDLMLDPASAPAQILLDAPVGSGNRLVGSRAGATRWQMTLGDNGAEAGSNAGSDFQLYRYTDAGAAIDAPLSIERATGKVTLGLNQIANVPQALAHRAGAGQVALATAAWTKINLGTIATTGAAGYFDLSGGGGNSLRILKAGVYFVWSSMLIQMPTTIGSLLGGFGYNSNTVPSRYFRTQNAAANNWQYTFPAMGVFNCAVNDYFTMLGYCSVAGAAAQDAAQETHIGAMLLSN